MFLEPTKIESQVEFQSLKSNLRSVITREGNSICADCNSKPVVSVSLNLGIFLCSQCEKSHAETLLPHVSFTLPIDNVRLDSRDSWLWNQGSLNIIRFLKDSGNIRSSQFWEKKYLKEPSVKKIGGAEISFNSWIGVFVKPDQETDLVMRNSWVEAKYTMKIFCAGYFEQEINVKYRGKCARLLVQVGEQELLLLDPIKKTKVDAISLTQSTSVRPFVNQAGELDNFEVTSTNATRSVQVLFPDVSHETIEVVFALHRQGCMVFPPKSSKVSFFLFSFFCFLFFFVFALFQGKR